MKTKTLDAPAYYLMGLVLLPFVPLALVFLMAAEVIGMIKEARRRKTV